MLLINFRTDYFIKQSTSIPDFKPLADHFQAGSLPHYTLPHCPIGEGIFSDLVKYISFSQRSKLDLNFHVFISACLERYRKSLEQRHYTTVVIHQQIGEKIRKYVLENYGDKMVDSIPGMASTFNVSVSTFNSITKNTFHKPFRRYVTDVRINEALILLITSTKTVYEVAFTVGYNDPTYFSQVFKQYHKMSPRELKQFYL